MKIEDIVTSVELSKELLHAGVSANTCLCWVKDPEDKYQVEVHNEFCYEMSCLEPVPCYTASELGIMLDRYVSNICQHDFGPHRYELSYANEWIKGGEYDTEVEAKGRMLLYLLRIGRFAIEEVNRRLNGE